MKNILNKLGYMSKPALIGTVLGIATVAVGIGLVTNFSGGSVKGIATPALEQYTQNRDGSTNLAAGYSKADIEASMALADQQRGVNSVDALRNAAAKDRHAFANSANADGAYNEYNADGTYGAEANGLESASGAGIDGIGAGVSGIDAAAAGAVAGKQTAANKAADAAKAIRMQGNIDRAGAQLVTSKGKINMGSSGGAGAGGSYSAALPTAPERATGAAIPQGLPSQLPGNNVSADSYKMGRAGALGGFGTKAGRGEGNGSGQQFYANGLSELSNASKFSHAGKKTVYGDASKGAALAGAAFDGSQASEGVQIGEGTNVAQEAGSALERSANPNLAKDLNKVGKLAQNVDDQIERAEDLRKKISGKIMGLIGVGVAGAILVQVFANMGGLWGWIGAGISAAVAIAGMLLLFYAGGNGIMDMISEIDSMEFGGGSGGLSATAWTMFGLMTAIIGISFIPGVYKVIAKAIAKAKTWFLGLFGL